MRINMINKKHLKSDKLAVTEVRQPSIFEGIARIIDISNALGNDYAYFAQRRGTYIVEYKDVQNSMEASVCSLNADWYKIGGDFNKTASKIERKYYKRLETV
jgi:hypothetical protein